MLIKNNLVLNNNKYIKQNVILSYSQMKNPSNLEFQKRFDSIAEDYEEISNQYTIERRIESFKKDSNGLVLEVGSGTGVVTEFVTCTVICTDISFKMCKQAKTKRPLVVCCDAEMLPFRENLFDTIISAEMIYYLENPEIFISYSRKILKKNGKLLISMANHDMAIVDKIRSLLRSMGLRRTYFNDGLKEFMRIEHLRSLLNKYNFKINSIEKKVIFPSRFLDKINRVLEKSPLNYFCIFIIIKAIAE